MRKLLALICLTAIVACNSPGEKVQVSGIINGKPLQLTPKVRQNLLYDSIKLLANCRYSSLDDGNTNKPHFEDAMKQSHLTFIFPKPISVEMELSEMKGEVKGMKEMVVTLPMSAGMIWVRSDRGTYYLAKFSPETSVKLERTLDDAQNR